MAAKPTIQLRTIFVIVFCAAVGLTCATAVPDKTFPGSARLYPIQNLIHFLLYSAAVAMIAGLVQQIRQLARLEPTASASNNNLRFALVFAVTWRAAIAFGLFICTVGQILLAREKIHLPQSDLLFVRTIFPDTLALICAIAVLASSNERWRGAVIRKERLWVSALAFVAGVIILTLMLRDTGLITFLVHIATQGIEVAQPGRFQRVGTFPDQAKEGFRLFWISASASVAAVVAAAALYLAIAARNKRGYRFGCLTVYALALAACAAFCVWYYRVEFFRISPDFAGVGLASSWIDRLSGAFIASIVITTIAYRTARPRGVLVANSYALNVEPGLLFLHEYAIFICLILAVPFVYLYQSLPDNFDIWNMRLGWSQQIAYTLAEYLSWPETYVYLAILVLSIQLLWQRWKRRGAAPALQLTPIDVRRFAWTWAALALLAAVGLPTLSIFSFTYWLGPWYLTGPR
jgi:hypothetical protein